MNRYIRVFVFFLFFPISLQAFDTKMSLELVSPTEMFEMKSGEPLEIQFKAVTSGNLFYAPILVPGNSQARAVKTKVLVDQPLSLKQGENSFKWDAQLPAGVAGLFYIKILVFDDAKKVRLKGEKPNYHVQKISQIRTKNFSVRP